MKKITGILGWPAHIVVITILIGLNSLQDPPAVSAAQEDLPTFSLSKVPADTAKLYLDCPDTTVVEGDSVDVFLIRVTNHQHILPFAAYWHTDAGTAGTDDYVHQNTESIWSTREEHLANRAKRTFETREDTLIEGNETFTARFTPTDLVVDLNDPTRDNKCVITIIDNDPNITDIEIISSPIWGGTYGESETIEFEATFSRAVDVDGNPALGLWVGSNWKSAGYLRGSGTNKLVFGYEVQSADRDDDGIKMDGGYRDSNGTWHNFINHTAVTATGTSTVAYRTYAGFGAQSDHKVDGSITAAIDPTISSIDITSDPGDDGAYGIGDSIVVEVTFSKGVIITGTPQLFLGIGDKSQVADYSAVSTDSLLVSFLAQVLEGHNDSNGISIDANKLTLNDGTIKDQYDNNADLTHDAVASDSEHKVDGVSPTISSIEFTSTPAPDHDATYAIGDTIEVTVTFSEDITVTGTPQIDLAFEDSAVKQASYVNANGDEAVFIYTVEESDSASRGTGFPMRGLTLNDGTIKDAVGNIADLFHRAMPFDSDHKVDGVYPTFSSAATSTDGLTVTMTFSEDINVHPMIVSLSDLLNIELGRIIKAVAGITVNNRVVEPSNASISGSDITLTLSAAITQGDTAKVDFNNHFARNAPGFFIDDAGNALDFFAYQEVTNNSTVAAGTAITADLVLTPTAFTVTEGAIAIYTVALKTQPSADVTVTISSSDSDKLSTDPTSLTFTTSNWNTAQTVTMTAAQDDDDIDYWVRLTHTASGGGYDSVVVGVNVIIDDDD